MPMATAESASTSTRATSVLPPFHCVVNGNGSGLRLAWNIARNHERGPEITQRAGEGQHAGGNHGAPRERQRHAPEDTPVGCAQVARRFLVAAVHGIKCRARRLHQQRNRVERGRHHRRLPGKYQRRAEHPFVKLSQRARPAQHHQQIVAEHRWRQHQRQCHHRVQQFFAAKLPVGQQVGDPQPESQRDQRRQSGHAQAEPQRKPVDGHRDSIIAAGSAR